MDFFSSNCQFVHICPSCKRLAFDPKVCFQCEAEIPPSTRIKVVDRYNRMHEITGYNVNNFSTNTFASFKSLLPPAPPPPSPPKSYACRPKGTVSSTSDSESSDLYYGHSKNCACVRTLKTEEEVRKSSLKAMECDITDKADVPNQHAAEEYIPVSQPDWVEVVRRVISIYEEDMACIADGERLNDSVIDCYLNYVHYEIIPAEFKDKTHIFNTCFNEFLKNVFEEQTTKKNWSDVQRSVQKWVKNVDIFSKDFIFVPVNRRMHWYLAVVCFVSQVVENSHENKELLEMNPSEHRSADDGQMDHPYFKKGRPCILYFDSASTKPIGTEKMSFASALIQFLEMVWNSRNPTEPRDWSVFACFEMPCPQQDNTTDCGLYLLQYVESFFKNPIPDIGGVMPTLDDWFPQTVIQGKRKEVKDVLSQVMIKRPQTANSFGSDIILLSP